MTKLKLVIVAASAPYIGQASTIANRLAGIEYIYLNMEKPIGCVRVVDFLWNNAYTIEIWDICGAQNYYQDGLPPIVLMESSGLMIVSHEVPRDLLQKNSTLFNSPQFPVLWLVDESNYRFSNAEHSLNSLNITKVHYGSPKEEIIPSEFNMWLSKVIAYLSNRDR
ncbi:hypothetical protein HDE_00736 [Halotydeus destructor]|nr:hypothetical protein HDE_00736 [Halotydeus destructor]